MTDHGTSWIASTYRDDLFYIKTAAMVKTWTTSGIKSLPGFREETVSKWKWWWYRLQFWRFKKMRNFNVIEKRGFISGL